MEKIIQHPWIIALILIWTLPWKAAALWRSARRGHLGWFLALIILNTMAILDILYIFIFSKPRAQKGQQIAQPQEPRRNISLQLDEPRQAQYSKVTKNRTLL